MRRSDEPAEVPSPLSVPDLLTAVRRRVLKCSTTLPSSSTRPLEASYVH